MPRDSSRDEERLKELLLRWHREWVEHARELSVDELCRDCPEFAAELTSRVQALKKFGLQHTAFRVEPAETAVLAEPAATEYRGESGGTSGMDMPPGYEMLGKVGEGGMGIVFKARNVALNRTEALKMIRSGEFAGPRELARFQFEAEAAAGLDHPNIVTVYGVGGANGRPFLAMRWIEGKSLADRGPTARHEHVALLAKVARAVHFAHQRGILHRDLKPGNILVDANGEPFVTDFGVARRLDRDSAITQAGGPVGTPAYMSPEQARGESNLRIVSDVYALGVVLYELLTGRLPFTGKTYLDVMKQIIEAQPPAPRAVDSAIDPDLEAICLKCLEKNVADRYPSAQALAADLECYLRGDAVIARPPGLADWLRQIWRTRPESTVYAWPVLTWFGVIILAVQVAVFCFAVTDASILWVWFAQVFSAGSMGLVVWHYLLRKFRRLPITERHSTMIAVGHLIAQVGLLIALVPMSLASSARDALGLYPPLTAISGMGCFIVGSTHWGRFVPIGIGMMAFIPVMAVWPIAAPLLYGCAVAGVMWYWAYSLGVTFAERRTPGTEKSII